MGFIYPLLRDLERLESLLARLNLSPMGCGSTNGSRLLQGRQQMADLLGFKGLISHARDAMWQGNLFIEATSILTTCSINLSRLAEDLQVYSTQEFALVELDDRRASASKIMPQKRNPEISGHLGTLSRAVRHYAAHRAENLVHSHELDGRSWKGEWMIIPDATYSEVIRQAKRTSARLRGDTASAERSAAS